MTFRTLTGRSVSSTSPCPRCSNGTVTDSNGSRWRCSWCGGTGVIADEQPKSLCSDQGCQRAAFKAGLCESHWEQGLDEHYHSPFSWEDDGR